jgi:hypothetical protein
MIRTIRAYCGSSDIAENLERDRRADLLDVLFFVKSMADDADKIARHLSATNVVALALTMVFSAASDMTTNNECG